MKRKNRTTEEGAGEPVLLTADPDVMRAYVAREREKLAAKRQAEAKKPRGLRRLLSF
jgi:hypothetical protein